MGTSLALCASFPFQTATIFPKPASDRLWGPFVSSRCKSEVVLLKLVEMLRCMLTQHVSTVQHVEYLLS